VESSRPTPWWETDPAVRDLGRRALEELQRQIDETDPTGLDDADPVVNELYSGACVRALATARDELARARRKYDDAISGARIAGLSWGEIGAVLGVSRQQLHRRFRHRR
jgi:DNA-directed RNA polymerase specialized sigma24 family protein